MNINMNMNIKKIIKIVIFIIIGIAIPIFQTILATADENGQEYTFYTAVKENATNYIEMGVTTPEPIDNIVKVEKQIKGNTNDGSYSFTIPESIYRVNPKNVTDKDKLIINIETLKGISKLTNFAQPGNVYIAENIWIEPDNAVYIDFKVKNSWLKDNGGDIQLFKWTGNQWKKLGHRMIYKDDSYTYFEEGIAGSSILTIVAASEQTNNPTYGPTVSPIEDNSVIASAREVNIDNNKDDKKFIYNIKANNINGAITILLILILITYIVQNELRRKK